MDGHTDQQRPVWKVSSALDRLDILCEQHHLQTEHHDGLPDWESHSEPAGIASETHVDVPVNFAWLRDNSKSSSSGGGANALLKKEAQVLQAQPTAPLPSHFHDEKRHFEHAGDESVSRIAQSSNAADTTGKRVAHQDEELEAARKIEELRLETQKFMARLVDIDHLSPHHSSSGDSVIQKDVHGFENNEALSGDSFQDHRPPSEDAARIHTPEVTGTSHVDTPHRGYHLDPQQTSGRRSVLRSSPAHAQPQASIFLITESKKHKLESPEYEKQHHPRANTRGGYRTTYSDANAWIQSDALLSSADFFKARQVIDAAAGPGTNYGRRYVLTAADALRVAKQSAREFLGENLQVPHVKSSGASPEANVSSSAHPAAPIIQCAASPANARLAMERDEATQTELDIHDAMYQLPSKVETSYQTDTKLLSPSAISLASGSKMRRARGVSHKHAPSTPSSARGVSSRKPQSSSSFKTRSLHENPKRNGANGLPYHHQSASSSSNPVLMYPRYPPVPMTFRAKSTYATEFGKVDPSKKRIPAR